MRVRHYNRNDLMLGPVLFFIFLIMIFLAAMMGLYFSLEGPIVLGTELNANGHVEYLCLGNGCNEHTAFAWSDK